MVSSGATTIWDTTELVQCFTYEQLIYLMVCYACYEDVAPCEEIQEGVVTKYDIIELLNHPTLTTFNSEIKDRIIKNLKEALDEFNNPTL